MTEKNKRPVYEPPRARDLSAYSVSGGDDGPSPMGTCAYGAKPYTACLAGTTPFGGACSVGSLVDQQPQCNAGSMASVTCWTGGDAG